MNVLAWSALGAALLAVPGCPSASARARALAARGRLAVSTRAARHRALHTPRAVGAPRGAGSWPPVAGTALLAVAVGLSAGAALGVASGALGGCLLAGVRSALARRREQRRRRELIDALRVLAAELESGARPADALGAAAAAAPLHHDAFAAAAQRVRAGELFTADDAHLGPLIQGWRVAQLCGIPLAAVLAQVGAELSARDEQRRAVALALAGPRSSAVLLAALPLLGIGLGTLMGANPLAFLFASTAGRVVCCAGVLLEVAGLAWTARLLRRAERP